MSAWFGLSSRLIRRANTPTGHGHSLSPCNNRLIFLSRVAASKGGKAWGRSHFSTVDGRQRGRFLTVAFTPEGYDKETIIEITQRALGTYHGKLGDSRAAVVLASKGLASWLEDPVFLSSLIAPWRAPVPEMDVLVGVVDGVRVSQDPSDPPPSEGIAIMTGEDTNELLPGLWEGGLAPRDTQLHHHYPQQQSKASIELHLPPFTNDSRRLHTTVPLANTVFTNGRPNTMFAVSLSGGEGSEPAVFTRIADKKSQIIAPGRGPRYFSSVSAPLVAVTAPHKVLQGLGNILRQLEVNGEPAPASRELEKSIPELLEARSKPAARVEERPLKVWAAIYPEQIVSPDEEKQQPRREVDELPPSRIGQKVPEPLSPARFGSMEEEVFSKEFRSLMPGILAGGGQIRQVLSGGGGWGQKQGLLSLDPESRYSTEDQEDIDSFIRSFKGEETAGSGIVAPGSWVQFLVERATRDVRWGDDYDHSTRKPYQELKQFQNYNETINLGVHDEMAEQPINPTLRVAQDYFGVSTSAGLYIESPAKAIPLAKRPVLTTKIAVPRTELVAFI